MNVHISIVLGLLLGGGSMLPAATLYNVTQLPVLQGFGYYDFSAINNNGLMAATLHDISSVSALLYSGDQFTNLGTLAGKGGRYSLASDINDAGQVTGSSETAVVGGSVHAFLYTNGNMIDVGALGGTNSYGLAVNDQGHVTGYSDIATFGQHAFFQGDGQIIDLAPLGSFNSRGSSINNNDQVTGTAVLEFHDPFGAHLRDHAFLYSNGQSIDLGSLGGSNSGGLSINNGGQVTGSSETADGSFHAFLYSNGQMMDLGTLPGWAGSVGESINNYGEVTGLLTGSHGTAAFVWRDGVMQNLNDLIDPTLGITLGVGIDINDRGQILAGLGSGVAGDFLLTPVPESRTTALLALGLSALCLYRNTPKARARHILPDEDTALPRSLTAAAMRSLFRHHRRITNVPRPLLPEQESNDSGGTPAAQRPRQQSSAAANATPVCGSARI
jgi:probable HAF family extracellular repeat protein